MKWKRVILKKFFFPIAKVITHPRYSPIYFAFPFPFKFEQKSSTICSKKIFLAKHTKKNLIFIFHLTLTSKIIIHQSKFSVLWVESDEKNHLLSRLFSSHHEEENEKKIADFFHFIFFSSKKNPQHSASAQSHDEHWGGENVCVLFFSYLSFFLRCTATTTMRMMMMMKKWNVMRGGHFLWIWWKNVKSEAFNWWTSDESFIVF